MSNHLNKHSSLAAQSLQQLKRDIILIPLGYPWTLSPPVFFFVNSSNSLLFWSYTLVPAFGWNYLPHEKGESEAQSFLLFSFLLKNWREWSTLFSWEPFGLWSAIWCLRTCQPLLSDSPMIYIYLSCAEPIPVSTAFPASSLLKWKGNIGGHSVLVRIPYRLWSHELYCFVLHCWPGCMYSFIRSDRHCTA